jgi:hypothetical protein
VKIRKGNELYATVLGPGETLKRELKPDLETGDGTAISEEKSLELTGEKEAEVLLFDLA